MEREDLIKIGRNIAKTVQVERIYAESHFAPSKQKVNLVILVPASCGIKLTELEPFIKMVIADFKDITFSLYQGSEVRHSVLEGNLYFLFACTDTNEIFSDSGAPNMPKITWDKLMDWIETANCNFDAGMARTHSFLNGAKFYRDKGDAALTAFMLHQFAELTYRALEVGLLTKEKRSHDLQVHQRYLGPILPQLDVPFTFEIAQEMQLLKCISLAYSAVRYDHNFEMDENLIPVYFQRFENLNEQARAIMKDLTGQLLSAYESLKEVTGGKDLQVAGYATNIPESKNGFFSISEVQLDGQIKDIRDHIIDKLKAEQIILFGKHATSEIRSSLFGHLCNGNSKNTRYHFLIISDHPNPYSLDLQGQINNKPFSAQSVLLLIHTQDEFIKKINKGNSFFKRINNFGIKLHNNNSVGNRNVSDVGSNLLSVSKLALYSSDRNVKSRTLLKSAERLADGNFEVAISLLSQAVEQSCMALIYVFLEYQPNLHRLSHLLGICKIFFPFPIQLLGDESDEDKRLLRILSNGYSEMRFKVGRAVSKEDFHEILRITSIFISSSEKLISEELVLKASRYDVKSENLNPIL